MMWSIVRAGAIGVALWSGATAVLAAPREQMPIAAGLWEKVDDSGSPEAWFLIYECGGVYVGQIAKIFPKPGENPSQLRCTKCEGEQKNAPVLGITFIKGMRRNGLNYENGTILDPRDGSVYSAQMELSPDGGRLTVRGYLGIPLLGQSQVWRRLPNTALDSLNPIPAPTIRDCGEVRTDRPVPSSEFPLEEARRSSRADSDLNTGAR
jgi:uncharacterized protein (DUF2147 family)